VKKNSSNSLSVKEQPLTVNHHHHSVSDSGGDSRVCSEEPDKPYEETVCGVAARLGDMICDSLGSHRDECKKIVKQVSEGKMDGKTARERIETLVGKENFDIARQKVIAAIENQKNHRQIS
jgi:hypothetical protein